MSQTEEIRKQLRRMDPEEVRMLCFDHFRGAYARFDKETTSSGAIDALLSEVISIKKIGDLKNLLETPQATIASTKTIKFLTKPLVVILIGTIIITLTILTFWRENDGKGEQIIPSTPLHNTVTCDPETHLEDNDGKSQACIIEIGHVYKGLPDDDNDVYKFELKEATQVWIEIDNYTVSGKEGGQLKIYDDAIQAPLVLENDVDCYLKNSSTLTPFNFQHGRAKGLVPGTYYIRVYTYPGDYQNHTPYTLQIGVGRKNDTHAPCQQ